MPKLNQQTAKKVAAAETKDFEVLPEGPYVVFLRKVDPNKTSSNGNPMWLWEFEVAEGEHKGRRLWTNTVLLDESLWAMKVIFDAYGKPTTTDTDDFTGPKHLIRVAVSQRVIDKGARKGEKANNIDTFMAYDGDGAGDDDADGPSDADGDEDLFD